MTIVAALFLVATTVVVPLGMRSLGLISAHLLPRRTVVRAVLPADVGLLVAFALTPGPWAGVFALPWAMVTGLAAFDAIAGLARDPTAWRPGPRIPVAAGLVFLTIGAWFAVADRAAVQPFGFSASIILLTAVHFHFAGFMLPLAGTLAWLRRPSAWLAGAIGLVIIGIPVTAFGFFGLALVNWVGSMLVAVGGLGIGLGTVLVAARLTSPSARALAAIAGASLLIAMPMAVVYATGVLIGTSWLDLPTMARTHGSLNALGFAVPVVLAWTTVRYVEERPSGPARARDVIAFNAAPFTLGPLAVAASALVLLSSLPLIVRVAFGIAAVIGSILTVGATIAVLWVFDWGSSSRWRWVMASAERPRRWLNVTTGFDDSTAMLRASLDSPEGLAVDLFDTHVDHEAALRRARRRFPPRGRSVSIHELGGSAPRSADAIFLLMSAHETDGEDRDRLFTIIRHVLTDGGRLVLVEHLRDLANAVAFGPGAWHFENRDAWIQTAESAGLQLVKETRLTPFVHGFVFEPAS